MSHFFYKFECPDCGYVIDELSEVDSCSLMTIISCSNALFVERWRM